MREPEEEAEQKRSTERTARREQNRAGKKAATRASASTGAAASSTTTTGHAGSAAPEVVRMETVRAAQERLDSQVASGALPDAATLGEIENARREAERAAGIHSHKCPLGCLCRVRILGLHSTDTRAA